MKDFRTYQAEHTQEKEEKAAVGARAAEELTRRALEAYDGKSSVAVLAEILSMAESAKRKGELTDEEIDAFYAQFAPLLEENQRKMLKGVTDRLKRL